MEEQTNMENVEEQKVTQNEPLAEAMEFEPIRDSKNAIHNEL